MKFVKFLSIFVIMMSCNTFTSVKFTLINKRDNLIDSIKISNSYDDVVLHKLKINQKMYSTLVFGDSIPRGDGNYFIESYSNNEIQSTNFGYFSNGIPSNSSFSIEIKNDTIIVDEKFEKDYY